MRKRFLHEHRPIIARLGVSRRCCLGTLKARSVQNAGHRVEQYRHRSIIPARFLTTTTKDAWAGSCSPIGRYRADGSPNPDFVLNRPEARGAHVLVRRPEISVAAPLANHAPGRCSILGFAPSSARRSPTSFVGKFPEEWAVPITVDDATSGWLPRQSGRRMSTSTSSAAV